MKIFTTVECPYCKFKNRIFYNLDDDFQHYRVIHCDSENGGCDLPFVIMAHITIKSKIRKIEGIIDEHRKAD